MKKLIVITMALCLLLVACGSPSATDSRTMKDIVDSIEQAGYTIVDVTVPLYQMIGASNGSMFYIDGSKVAIYQYKDAEDLKAVKNEYVFMEKWPANGKYLLETNVTEINELFLTIG